MQMTREVIMGREAETKRTLPYITRYEKEDDFEGRIVVLEAASGSQPEPEAASEQVSEPAEVEFVAETEDTIETEPAPAAEPYAAVEPEVEPVAETETADQPDEQKRGWLKFFGGGVTAFVPSRGMRRLSHSFDEERQGTRPPLSQGGEREPERPHRGDGEGGCDRELSPMTKESVSKRERAAPWSN